MSKFPYAPMRDKQDMLERLDVRIRWGAYDIRVLRFHLVQFAAGYVIGAHKHDEFEFHFIPQGKGSVVLEGQPYALREGMFYLTGPGVLHRQEAAADEAMYELCLHVDIAPAVRAADATAAAALADIAGGRADTAVSEAGAAASDRWEFAEAEQCVQQLRRLPPIPRPDAHEAMPHFLEAYRACSDNVSGLYTTVKHHVVQILLKAARAYDEGPMRQPFPSRDMKAYRYRLALEYIRANYSGSVSLDSVADVLNISARQLQRIFREAEASQSFRGILEQVRLEAVCRKLADTDMPVEQIALTEGFASGNYLHTVFRKRYGITPAQYRRNYENGTNRQRTGGRSQS